MDIKPIHNQSPQPQLPSKPPTQQPTSGQATQPPLSHTNKMAKVTLRQSRPFTKLSQVVAPIHKLTTPLKPHTSKLTTKLSGYTTKLSQYFLLHPIVKYASMSLLVLVLSASVITIRHYQHIHSYDLSNAEQSLLGKSTINPSKINQTTKDISFNLKSAETTAAKPSTVTVASSTNATGNFPYQATLSKKASDGMSFGSASTTSASNSAIPGNSNNDASSDSTNSFKLIPQFSLSDGQLQPDGQVIYPGTNSTHQVFTFKRNGVKQDILLTKPIGDSTSYTWKLDLPNSLQAKLMSNGGVGIYSANPLLSDPNLQVGDAKTQELIAKAKLSGAKDYLAYVIPAPYLLESTTDSNKKPQPNYTDVKYSLNGFDLTLTVKNLKTKNYPLTIDPTVTVTTTADFQTAYYDDGMINYGTANQIGRNSVSVGIVGTWNYTAGSTSCATWTGTCSTSSFLSERVQHTTVAYNGYLYVIGGLSANSANDCTSTNIYCKGIQYAPINSNGTIGTWKYTTNGSSCATWASPCNLATGAYVNPRYGHSTVAYSGYLYILGGLGDTSTADCTATSCNGVQYAPINTNGTIGAWHYTHSSTDDSTTFVAGFTTARSTHTSVAYNGYLYVIGGSSGSYLNDVQYAPINSNGTVGTWTSTTSFINARGSHASIAYNGYMYVIGGGGNGLSDCTSSDCNGTQFAPINSNGTIGTWNYTAGGASCSTWTSPCSTGFTNPRASLSAVATNGYLYILGGQGINNANDCINTSNLCTGLQFTPINSNGTIGAWHYTHASTDDSTTYVAGFTKARSGQTAVAYNGYIYLAGGGSSSGGSDCSNSAFYCSGVQYVPINTGTPTFGTAGSTWNTTTAFTTSRYLHTSVAYNGYLYILGGYHITSDTACNDTASNSCSDVQYAPISSNGTVGAWHYTHNSTDDGTSFVAGFITARNAHTSVAYNGYLYVIGGLGGSNLNDVQYAPINSNGTVGAWHYTHNSTDDGTSFVAGFTNVRNGHTSVAYNGYLYVIGGYGGGYKNDVQYAPINGNGTIGTWATTTAFTTARTLHTSVAYNGYLYVIGGDSGSSQNDVQYALICTGSNSGIGGCGSTAGTVGTWATTTAFTTARNGHTSVAYNGYLYVIGGNSGSFQNDVQYALICTGSNSGIGGCGSTAGTVGTWATTTAFTTARNAHTSVAYNGYLYVIGGNSGSFQNDVQYNGLLSPAQSARYERMIDAGIQSSVYQFTYNGTAPCGVDISYRTAGSSGVFGSVTSLPNAQSGVTYTPNVPSVRYLDLVLTINDQSCGGTTSITDFTIQFGALPNAPTLSVPNAGATGVPLTPIFRFSSTDPDVGDYLQYEIQICTTSNCSSVLTTVCQNSSLPNSCSGSQVGWSSQSLQSGTAYSSGQYAVYTYQGALSPNTQYWWRAYAIDPGSSNTSSSVSSIGTFTTLNPNTNHGVCIGGC